MTYLEKRLTEKERVEAIPKTAEPYIQAIRKIVTDIKMSKTEKQRQVINLMYTAGENLDYLEFSRFARAWVNWTGALE